jgi:nitrogen fixation/metabolism regulation signal transduction histidine kinase
MSIKNAKTCEEITMLNESFEGKVKERTKTLNKIVEDLKSQDESKRDMQNTLLETNTNIKNILDNAEEGFLTFDERLKIYRYKYKSMYSLSF